MHKALRDSLTGGEKKKETERGSTLVRAFVLRVLPCLTGPLAI
jgi:hypothetical protein